MIPREDWHWPIHDTLVCVRFTATVRIDKKCVLSDDFVNRGKVTPT